MYYVLFCKYVLTGPPNWEVYCKASCTSARERRGGLYNRGPYCNNKIVQCAQQGSVLCNIIMVQCVHEGN